MQNKKPIRIILALLAALLALPLSAQHYVGIRGGAVAGKVRFKPTVESEYLLPTPVFGLTWKFYGAEKVLGGVQVDLNVINKGFKVLDEPKSDTSYRRTITALEIPFMWQPHANLFHNHLRVFLNVGPYVSYALSSKDKKVSKKNGTLWKRNYDYDMARDNRLECGLVAGGGIAVAIRRFEIQAEFRYVYGFSDILKNPTKYKGNPDQSPIDQMNLSVALYYKIFEKKK